MFFKGNSLHQVFHTNIILLFDLSSGFKLYHGKDRGDGRRKTEDGGRGTDHSVTGLRSSVTL